MSGRSVEFYADDDDVRTLVVQFDEIGDFRYAEFQSELNNPLTVYVTAKELCSAFRSGTDGQVWRSRYLVVDSDTPLQRSVVKMRNGSGVKEYLDQYTNPDSIELRLGGDVGDDTLILSDICTLGDTPRSRNMHTLFKQLVLKNTKRIGPKGTPYRLMPGAIGKLEAGWRLARGKNQSIATDPRISTKDL